MASVEEVFSSGPPERCYLVEWYQSALLRGCLDDAVAQFDGAADADATAIRLLLTLAAPTDEVLYGVFTADSPDTVERVCRRAGWPPDRITARIEARIAVPPC